MQINPISNNNFKGIKLSSYDYDRTRYIADRLEAQGYYCLGKKSMYCSNTLNDKINLGQYIRNRAHFYANGFGAIFLPWSKEAYFLSTPKNEQKLYNIVKKFDKDAYINLAI